MGCVIMVYLRNITVVSHPFTVKLLALSCHTGTGHDGVRGSGTRLR